MHYPFKETWIIHLRTKEYSSIKITIYLIPSISIFNPLRTVIAYMHQGNKLDYHVQTIRYNFAALHPTNLKLLSFCSVYSAKNSNVLGRT